MGQFKEIRRSTYPFIITEDPQTLRIRKGINPSDRFILITTPAKHKQEHRTIHLNECRHVTRSLRQLGNYQIINEERALKLLEEIKQKSSLLNSRVIYNTDTCKTCCPESALLKDK